MIFGAFDAYPEAFYERDGAIVNGTIQPGAKDALELLHSWYDAGYLDPEFAVNTGDNVKEKWLAEKFGFLQTAWYEAIPQEAFYDGFYYDKLMEKNADAIITIIPTIAGPDGYKGCVQTNPIVSSGVQYSADIDPVKMEKYMEIAEYTSFDEVTTDLVNFGVEGVTFEYDDENFTNWLPPYDDESKRWEYGVGSLGSFPGSFNDYEYLSRYMTKPRYKELRVEAEAGGCGEYDIMSVYERPIYNEYADTLKQLTNKNYIDFITGDRSLDEFDDFVSEWLAAGGQEVLDEAQQVYYAE